MGIRVEHAANPSAVITAAHAAGQGQARQKAAIGAAQAASAKGRQESAQKFQAEMLERKHEMGMEDALLQQGLGREDFEWRLTAQQKADQEKYANVMYAIDKSDWFTEDEKLKVKRRMAARLAGIEPLPMRRDKEPSPEEMFGKRTYTDKATGVTYPINPQTGEFGRPIYDPQTAVKSRIEATKAAIEYARDSESGALDKTKFEFAMRQMLGGEGTGGGTPGLPAPAGGAARSLPAPTGLEVGAAAGATPQPGLPAEAGEAAYVLGELAKTGQGGEAPSAPAEPARSLPARSPAGPLARGPVKPLAIGEIMDVGAGEQQLEVAKQDLKRLLKDKPSKESDRGLASEFGSYVAPEDRAGEKLRQWKQRRAAAQERVKQIQARIEYLSAHSIMARARRAAGGGQ